MSGATLPMEVDQLGFLVDRLGRDCAPLQYVRELTQNSIEAILRTPEKAGEIVWDIDWNYLDLAGVYKLAIIDTGDGMAGEDLVRYINHLSASKGTQSFVANYGVGAKIAAATRNPHGLMYLSWQNGPGHMIHLWRDPDSNVYGLKRFEVQDGRFAEVVRIDDDLKPPLIGRRGTMVVLMGESEEDNTALAPDEASGGLKWISKYLNTRYFTFPEGISVKAREFARGDDESWPKDPTRQMSQGAILRTVDGQKGFLDRYAEKSGDVKLVNATARWWILRDPDELQGLKQYETRGHIAALYQNELYEMVTGRSATSRLQEFGVIFGSRRVVIYVEPDSELEDRIYSNTSRSHLLLDGEPLPWNEWAAQFRDSMPVEIRDLVEDMAPLGGDHRQNIHQRLRDIADLFRLSRYRPAKRADQAMPPDAEVGGGRPASSDPKTTKTSRSGGGMGGRAGGVYALFATTEGDTPAEEVHPHVEPKYRWVSVENGSREPEDMEDRAAKYLPDQNLLLINEDFRGYRDLVERWKRRYEGTPGATPVIIDVVQEWVTQQLIETVLGVQGLRGARYWAADDVAKALSEEALTSAVMPKYHLDRQIGRNLGARLGSLKERAS